MAEYIDKQKLIDELDDKYSLGDIGRMEHDIIVNALLYAKPADVRPVVRGKWKITSIYIKCLECGECFMLIPQNFCPNCGADMRGTQDE